MDSQQDNFVAAMRQVQTFISSAPTPEIGAIASSGMMTTFNAAVATLADLGVAQKQNTQAAQGETTKQGMLRDRVLQAMAPIAKVAKVKLTTLPELSAFRVPRADTKSAQLIIAATAMANAEKPVPAATSP